MVGLLLPENNTEGKKCSIKTPDSSIQTSWIAGLGGRHWPKHRWGALGGPGWSDGSVLVPVQLWPLSPCQECGGSPGSSWELGQCLGLIQGRAVLTLGGLAPHAEPRQDGGHRCCILCTLRVSVPPGDFLPGCGSTGSRVKPAAPVGTAGLCLSVVPSDRGNLLLPLPPPWGLCPPGSPSQPQQELQWCLCAMLGVFAGNVPHPWEDPFVPEQTDSRAFGLLSFRVGLQKS